jgi:hypothetical protein
MQGKQMKSKRAMIDLWLYSMVHGLLIEAYFYDILLSSEIPVHRNRMHTSAHTRMPRHPSPPNSWDGLPNWQTHGLHHSLTIQTPQV